MDGTERKSNSMGLLIKFASTVFTVTVVVMSVVVAFYILLQKNNVSSNYIVYTVMRTLQNEDRFHFPVVAPEQNTPQRYYSCLMDANVYRKVGGCDTQDSVNAYRQCLGAAGARACDSFIPMNVDNEFLECIQPIFNVTYRQSNLFTSCLALSQDHTYQSIQGIDSAVFLGSYNYAHLLVNGLIVMASFLVLTGGGWFPGEGSVTMNTEKDMHLTGYWSPFSIYRVLVAFIWSLIALVASVIIAYNNGDVVSNMVDNSKRFPTTLWTSVLSVSLYGIVTAFYLFYVFEYFFSGESLFGQSKKNEEGGSSKDPALEPTYPSPIVNPPGNSGLPELPPVWAPSSTTGSYFRWRSTPGTLSYRVGHAVRWNPRLGRYVGIKMYSNPASDSEIHAADILPLMLQAFAWTWVLTDGFFFVGMLTPQSSVTSETVARVFIGITIARLFQLAVGYLSYKAFVAPGENRIGVIATCVLAHAASLFCIVAVTIEFSSTLGFSSVASKDLSVSYYGLQIMFILLVICAPELWRLISTSVILNYSGHGSDVASENVLLNFELLYLWEWVSRFIFALIVIFAFTVENQQNTVGSYLEL